MNSGTKCRISRKKDLLTCLLWTAADGNHITMAPTTSQYQPYTANQFLVFGLEMRSNGKSEHWRHVQHETKISNFVKVYSVHPQALESIWVDIQVCPYITDRISKDIKPEHVLVVYLWLNEYESEEELHTALGYNEKSIRKWCHDITKIIADLRKIKVLLHKIISFVWIFSCFLSLLNCFIPDRPKLGR